MFQHASFQHGCPSIQRQRSGCIDHSWHNFRTHMPDGSWSMQVTDDNLAEEAKRNAAAFAIKRITNREQNVAEASTWLKELRFASSWAIWPHQCQSFLGARSDSTRKWWLVNQLDPVFDRHAVSNSCSYRRPSHLDALRSETVSLSALLCRCLPCKTMLHRRQVHRSCSCQTRNRLVETKRERKGLDERRQKISRDTKSEGRRQTIQKHTEGSEEASRARDQMSTGKQAG